ncbi:hypothetical protein GCM10007972_25420 [Iodidimonas muriae]|uniref:DUF1476 domain-containing protein n=1 Tax=Iodidimonas muriae TaxID=261467 RepID=A0ABQ2LG44_9PROT|nr:DUF1476 domain-containing protein [Iodidimonas muriae]GER08294.1 hypothetical protein JCM17843_26040 [Kordiimonadales bacterium JCM 17843]GGO16386.1 hypothetical protein GCM10007972_25420 [Iodidimonas muriae]
MTDFNDREQNFERKYAHDEELRFKAAMRRNKLLGLWAAEKLGLSGDEATDYAKSVIEADFEEVGDADVIRKVSADFQAKGIEISTHQVEHRLQECMEEARNQIMKELG